MANGRQQQHPMRRREDETLHTSHSSRLDRLEGIVEGLATNQAKLETSMSAVATNVEKLTATFAEFSKDVRDGSRTNWSTLISAGALVLALGTALGTGFVGIPLGELESDFESNSLHSRKVHIDLRTQLQDVKENKARAHAEMRAKLEQLQKDMDHSHERQHDLEKRHDDVDTKVTEHDSRLQNLERLIFPSVRYRDGRPNG